MTAKEIMKKYPGLHNLPDDYIGCIHDDAGIVRVKNAINGFRILSEENGADLKYNSKVVEVSKNHVKLADGSTFNAEHVVVCGGAYTTELFDKTNTGGSVIEVEIFSK